MEKLVEWNDRLFGAPTGVLVFLGCIGFGYVLKSTHWIPNHIIPTGILLFGVGMFMIVAPTHTPDVQLRVWIGRNILVGIIISAAAWLLHRFALKKIEKKFSLFANSIEDEEKDKKE